MKYHDLRDFLKQLEKQGELKRITVPVDPYLEMTEICNRTLKQGGPALLFENPIGYNIPVLGNLFGTPRRVAMGMGAESVTELRRSLNGLTMQNPHIAVRVCLHLERLLLSARGKQIVAETHRSVKRKSALEICPERYASGGDCYGK